MKNKKVIITGGAGFIGSHIAKKLSIENQVTIIDNLSTGHIENINDIIDNNSVNFIKGDINDLDLLKKISKNVDYIFHQAAIASVPFSIKDPIKTNKVNINGTLNVLTAAKENNVKKIVFASSSAIYGDSLELPLRETTRPNPLSPYAITKLIGEYYCDLFFNLYGLQTVALRYFNVYGPRQDPNNEYAAVIPKFIIRVLNNQSPIIFGDGKQTRDFIFVEDVVSANILAAESKQIGVFNIASGEKISINDLAQSIIKITEKELVPIYKEQRLGEIKDSVADISKSKNKMDFKPKYNLGDGLKITIREFQK